MTNELLLTDVLRSGRQADEDGTEVTISRQAVEMAADEIEALNKRIAELTQLRGNLSLAEEGLASATQESASLAIQRDHWLEIAREKDVEIAQLKACWSEALANVTARNQEIERLRASFKNFHRLLCERFDYGHDEADWERDQLSLIEWIAKRHAHEAVAENHNDALRSFEIIWSVISEQWPYWAVANEMHAGNVRAALEIPREELKRMVGVMAKHTLEPCEQRSSWYLPPSDAVADMECHACGRPARDHGDDPSYACPPSRTEGAPRDAGSASKPRKHMLCIGDCVDHPFGCINHPDKCGCNTVKSSEQFICPHGKDIRHIDCAKCNPPAQRT